MMSTHTNEAPQASFAHGPFRVLRTLGVGGYAKAVAAQDIPSNRMMCIKVSQKHNLKHTALAISKELGVYQRLASAMPCPAAKFLMGLELSFETKDEICFAMDLMASDLDHLMIYRSSYCLEHASRWTMQIALGINALHDLGIIHRDIKAENILIDIRENARIGDFGLSHLEADARPLNRQGAYSTSVMGTLHCMAPDILLNISIPSYMKYGPPVDWWSLGCVVFRLVSPDHKPLFETQQHILSYVNWCTSNGSTHRQYPSFQKLKDNFGDLISGLLDPCPTSRYGFNEVSGHPTFLYPCGTSAFVDAYSCALKRPEVPELLPDLRCGREPAKVLQRLAPGERRRFPNLNWCKPI